MKRKIINGITDIIFIMIVFSVTDWIVLNVYHTDAWWLELLTYLVIYAALAGVRWVIRHVWCRLTKRESNINDTEKE